MAMFVFNKTALAVVVVVAGHVGLVLLMLGGQSPESLPVPVQAPVIQGMLVAAAAPPLPEPPPATVLTPSKKVAPKPEPMPLVQKVSTEEATALIEEPPEDIVEPSVEPEKENLPLDVEPQAKPVPEVREPPPRESLTETAASKTANVTEVIPPRVDAYQHNNPAPKYPKLSKRLREEGVVILQLLITQNGTVDEVNIKTSSGYPRLDKAAIKAVKQWRYVPAQQGDETISYRYEQPIHFAMK